MLTLSFSFNKCFQRFHNQHRSAKESGRESFELARKEFFSFFHFQFFHQTRKIERKFFQSEFWRHFCVFLLSWLRLENHPAMRYFVVLSLFCLILVTVKADPYLDNDLLNGEWVNTLCESYQWMIRSVGSETKALSVNYILCAIAAVFIFYHMVCEPSGCLSFSEKYSRNTVKKQSWFVNLIYSLAV